MFQQKKGKIINIIFMRACCCIGIVVFHYFCHSNGKFKFLHTTANSDFGFMFVTSFFCISGFVLYYKYPEIFSIKQFYYKRWKQILVPYYICYIYCFFQESFRLKRIVFSRNLQKFLLNIFGLDGYFLYRIRTHYLIGEWFLGAIIIIYILYPLILFLTNKINTFINITLLCIFYFIMYYQSKFFIIKPTINIITCIASFYFGMVLFRFKLYFLYNNKAIIIFSLLLFLLCTIRININFNIIIFQLQGFCLFIFLFKIGYYVMNTKLHLIFDEINNISYGIYLFQHRLILDILSIYNPSEWYAHIFLLLFTLILILICSKIHLIVVDYLFKSYIFKKLDKLFIS